MIAIHFRASLLLSTGDPSGWVWIEQMVTWVMDRKPEGRA